MRIGSTKIPPSRVNKNQIIAFIDPTLAVEAHRLRRSFDLTIQEFIAEVINKGVAQYYREPILKVARERIINRKKAIARANIVDPSRQSRIGKVRLAGWFDKKDVLRVNRLTHEFGITTESLVLDGINELLKVHNLQNS